MLYLDFVQVTFPSRKNQKDFYNKLFWKSFQFIIKYYRYSTVRFYEVTIIDSLQKMCYVFTNIENPNLLYTLKTKFLKVLSSKMKWYVS